MIIRDFIELYIGETGLVSYPESPVKIYNNEGR
jgi:hypothetical protein